MCCLIFTALHPQGKNIKDEEFNALGDMLAQMTWELPQVEEYKNDLVQPEFLGQAAVPPSTSQTLAIIPSAQPDPAGPCTAKQWDKATKMVV